MQSKSVMGAATADDAILISSTLFDSVISEDLRARGVAAIIPIAYLVLRLPDVFPVRELVGSWDAFTDPGNRGSIETVYALLADEESRRVLAGKRAFYARLDKAELDAIRSDELIYFDPALVALIDDEIVVDGGAYVGDTLEEFLTHAGGRFRSYYAFEPDPTNLAGLLDRARGDQRVTIVDAGLGASRSTARLVKQQGFDSRLEADGDGEQVSIVALDDFFRRRPAPTLIKMDIEGMEAAALAGARRVIEEAQPILAISAYHNATDLWTIPLLMHALLPEARLYLRHYTREVDDTVCYAIPRSRQRTNE